MEGKYYNLMPLQNRKSQLDFRGKMNIISNVNSQAALLLLVLSRCFLTDFCFVFAKFMKLCTSHMLEFYSFFWVKYQFPPRHRVPFFIIFILFYCIILQISRTHIHSRF